MCEVMIGGWMRGIEFLEIKEVCFKDLEAMYAPLACV